MPPSTPLTLDQLLGERPWLERLCERLVRDSAEADDLAQETMIRALGADSAASAHARGKLRGWLASTVRHVAQEARRSSGRRLVHEKTAAGPDQLDITPESAMAGAELREQISRLVLKLPDDERQAVVMRYYEGLRPAEIAACLGNTSSGAVRQRIHRGMAKLRKDLERESRDGRGSWLPAALVVARRLKSAVPHAAVSGSAGWISSSRMAALATALVIVASLGPILALLSRAAPAPPRAMAVVQLAPTQPAEPGSPMVSAPEARPHREPAVLIPTEVHGERSFRILHQETGEPIAGAAWYAIATGENDPEPFGAIDAEYLPPPPLLASGVTDARGLIVVPPVADDAYQLVIGRGRNHAAGAFAIDASDQAPGTTDLTPPIGTTYTGRIVDAFGTPVPDAEIMEYDLQEQERILGMTQADGSFEISGVGEVPRQLLRREDGAMVHTWSSSSMYFVRGGVDHPWTRLPTWGGTDASLENPEGAPTRDVGDVVIEEPWVLRGRVIGEDGKPVAGALIQRRSSSEIWPRELHDTASEKTQPWHSEDSRPATFCDGEGEFELRVLRQHQLTKTHPKLVALAADGRYGTAVAIPPERGAEADLVVLQVTGKRRIRLDLQDRMRPGQPIDIPSGVRPIAGWRSLETLRGQPIDSPDTHLAMIVGRGVVSIPRAGLSWTAPRSTIELEVPGYEMATVEIPRGLSEVTVLLDRRTRRRVPLSFGNRAADPHSSVGVALLSELPDRLLGSEQPLSAWSKTACAGGVTIGLQGGEVVDLAWPHAKPAWLVVFRHYPGQHSTPAPTVFGPLFAPKAGEAIDIPLAPWTRKDPWGPRDLDSMPEVRVY